MTTQVDYTKDLCRLCNALVDMPPDGTSPYDHYAVCPGTVRGWDTLAAAGKTPATPRPFGPSKYGSRLCRSGSLASGGSHDYCTCDTCF